MNIETLKYPIGKLNDPGSFDANKYQSMISEIEQFPARLVSEVGPLTPSQQAWIYRPNGWTIKQVIHHCADSHMNAMTRVRWTLTENQPTIKAYLETEWAKQADYELPIIHSIKILEGLHHRWANLLKQLSEESLNRTFIHPETGKTWNLYFTTGQYAWHCNHHLAHIKQAKKYQGDFSALDI